jgi:hypothetical protein
VSSYIKHFYCQILLLRNNRLFLTALHCMFYKYIALGATSLALLFIHINSVYRVKRDPHISCPYCE